MKRWIIVILAIGLIFAVKFIFFAKKDQSQPANKNNAALPVAVNYYIVKSGNLSNDVFATGKTGALNSVDIVPEIGGKVTDIYFKEGETVNKGSLIVKLNDADLQAQLLKLKTQLKQAEQKTERLKKLLTISGVSQEEFEMQENEVLGLKADEAFISAQLAKTTIVAPFTGVVGLKNISEGSFVNSNSPIVSLVQLKPLFIEFSIPEKYSSLIKKETTIRFSADTPGSTETFTATVYAIEPRVEESTKSIKARAMYTGNRDLYPGSFVKVYVNLEQTRNAIMIPTQSIIPTLKGQKVFVNRNGIATETSVKIGVRSDQRIQVLEGLTEGDSVITTGLLSVKSGSRLKLLKAVN